MRLFLCCCARYLQNVRVVGAGALFFGVLEEFICRVVFIVQKHVGLCYNILSDLFCSVGVGMRLFCVFWGGVGERLFLQRSVSVGGSVCSISSYYECARWLEREVSEFFGVLFIGHQDLRRLLLDYGFEGNPLVKEFPVFGYREVVYDERRRRVMYLCVSFLQSARVGGGPLSVSWGV